MKVNGIFVSEKISKIRWLPCEVDKFVTGSWNSPKNHIKIWSLFNGQYTGDLVPKCCDQLEIKGNVTGLEFIDKNHIISSFAEGHISCIRINRDSNSNILMERSRKNGLHKYTHGGTAACTGVSVHDEHIATIGEDGSLNIISSNGLLVLRNITNADNCSLAAVLFVNRKEVLTGNGMGVMKLFDIRNTTTAPVSAFLTSCRAERKSNSVTSICNHPTQKHIILSGSEEGSITVWDLRQLKFPASYLSAHTNAITELSFHKTQPTILFSAAENGELWQWNQTNIDIRGDPNAVISESGESSPWLNGDRAKNNISVNTLITGIRKSINSFDAFGSQVICGSDSEALYVIENNMY